MDSKLCGLDEAGRGALAGPLVAAGVILQVSGKDIATASGVPLRDSKTLSKRQRERFYEALLKSQSHIATQQISVELINKNGIGWANKEIFRMLIRKLSAEQYIIDGNLTLGPMPDVSGTVRSIIDADATEESVICAGIIAKVTRDSIMQSLHAKYPQYGWDHNAGYGTKEHVRMIRKRGIIKEHRTQFVQTALRKCI